MVTAGDDDVRLGDIDAVVPHIAGVRERPPPRLLTSTIPGESNCMFSFNFFTSILAERAVAIFQNPDSAVVCETAVRSRTADDSLRKRVATRGCALHQDTQGKVSTVKYGT